MLATLCWRAPHSRCWNSLTVGSTDSPPIEVLSLIDTPTWKVLKKRELPYRLIYKMAGFPIMVLSADGYRLVVDSSDTPATTRIAQFWPWYDGLAKADFALDGS